MGRRFVPVPYEALACCGRGEAVACVVALYKRAHAERWEPFRCSVREFGAPGGLGHGAASQLLADLEERGLVKRDPSGHRTTADMLTVADPSADESSRDTSRDTTRDTRDADADAMSGEVRDTPAGHDSGRSRAEETRARVGEPNTEPNPPSEEKTDSRPPEPTNGRRADWDRAHAAYLDGLVRIGRHRAPVTPRGAMGRALMARISEHGVEKIVALMQWWSTSPHERAAFLRDKGCNLKTLTRPENCEEYLQMMAEGAPTPARQPRATGPPAYESFASMLAREAAASPLTLTLLPEEDPPDGH